MSLPEGLTGDMAKPPEGWILPSVILYVAAADPVGRSNKKGFARDLKAVSRRANLDGLEARMVWRSGPRTTGMADVCDDLAWLVQEARNAPMPRLLYVARFCDLAPGRCAFLRTLRLLLDAGFAVRACDGLLSAADRSLESFRASNAVVAPPLGIRTQPQSAARRTSARVSRGGMRIPPTLTGEA